jgi:hypothetical protein
LLRQRRFPSTAVGERRAEMLDASADLDSIGWYKRISAATEVEQA